MSKPTDWTWSEYLSSLGIPPGPCSYIPTDSWEHDPLTAYRLPYSIFRDTIEDSDPFTVSAP